ncbi:glycosyltransferase [Nocardioides psychrotolerans]|uniref:glycosyltransferase n=1 Tax=Nocardioides psychrotolerans TaxID=1005945 RepID=UPI003137C101
MSITTHRSAEPQTLPRLDLPLVAVFVGTDHHPFDRVLGWADAVAAHGRHRWFVQHGSTSLPGSLDGEGILSTTAMSELLERADAVVTHAGPGMIMEARAAGHLPIVVPRDSGLGEHVDDHQLRFARRVGDSGLVTLVQDQHGFATALDQTLRRGRIARPEDDHAHEASARFGRLVDQLVHRR